MQPKNKATKTPLTLESPRSAAPVEPDSAFIMMARILGGNFDWINQGFGCPFVLYNARSFLTRDEQKTAKTVVVKDASTFRGDRL